MSNEKNKKPAYPLVGSRNRVRWGILLAVAVIFAILRYPNLIITQYHYELGDVAERDVKAPKDFLVEDTAATESKRRQAAEGVLTVYDYDGELSTALSRNLEQAVGDLKKAVQAAHAKGQPSPVSPSDGAPRTPAVESASFQDQIWEGRNHFEEKIGIQVNQGAYQALEKEKFSPETTAVISRILAKILENGVVTNKEILLKETDKGIILRDVSTKEERVVHNLKQFYGLDQAKAMVRIIGQPFLTNLDDPLRNLVVDFAQRLLQPNITLNRSATQEREKKAAADIEPVMTKIKAGEMLLREGERVTEVQLLKLKTLLHQTQKAQNTTSSLGAALLVLSLLITTDILHLNRQNRMGTSPSKNLLLMASLWVTFFFVAEICAPVTELFTQNSPFPIPVSSLLFGLPLASGAMIVCLFLGLAVALPFALVLALCVAVIFQNNLAIFTYFLINGSMAAYWIRNCRERKVFITAGAKIGVLNVVLATAIEFYSGEFSGPQLLSDWAFCFLGGMAAGIVTAGIVPLVEIAFDYTTDITLLELANLDRPILRRLMIEAPGTYHHSVIVGSLVEAAASTIGANPLLAKVCGYYHDIGKIRKPLYFIENQTAGKNKHDKLAPSMSSLILIAHIKDGVEIARENKLGQVIMDTIRQHHGTSLIKYFYEKAKQRKGEDKVNIDDFRYPGPKPQTREAGLVMLADVVEAASRTLDNPTPSRIQGLVQNLINQIFSDGQLDACELTLKDLHNIAKSFNKILYGIHHHRIEYIEKRTSATEDGKGKTKNGSSDRQPAKANPDLSEEDTKNGGGHLKRLGLSSR
ncbi:MAG: HDIG domain-containing protein [Desulfobacterales bacterium]|nr:MAG: HDIG domain-containing protein [Desulfobacterales bacterium]